VGEETWNAGDRVETEYEKSKSPWSGANMMWLILCFTFFPGARQIISQLVCNKSAKISAFVFVCAGGLPLLTTSV